ncbi:MAG: DNA-binding response regulator [Chloroflexi bacterium]|nr:MAG: DNA-binding response regulator [Chloroflexota bacterium]
MAKAHILVVDDEAAERITLGEVLRLEGYHVSLAASGEEALSLIQGDPSLDLAILDLRLPGIDGLKVLDALHKSKPEVIAILITGYGTLDTAIQAMRKGAYDYLLKPCPVEKILETVRRGLAELAGERHRRLLVERLQHTAQELLGTAGEKSAPSAVAEERFLQVGNVIVDRAKHLVTLDGRQLNLTPTEFRLLECLLQRVDEVCTPQELVRCAQGYEADAWGARSIVRVHIRRLRSKMEPVPEHPRYILNVRGIGYMFASNSDRVSGEEIPGTSSSPKT